MQTRVRLLIADYDWCTFTTYGSHPQLLSKSFIEFAKAKSYTGFYGCTHRLYSELDVWHQLMWQTSKTKFTYDQYKEHYPTYKITENFQRESGLQFHLVSSLDDIVLNECGLAYEKYIKPYELEKKLISKNDKYITLMQLPSYGHTKNPQLLQIAKDAAKRYPGADIEMDYVDDIKHLCTSALEAHEHPEWPTNVKLNVYNHVANCDNAPIIPMQKTPIQASSYFSYPSLGSISVAVQGLFGSTANLQPTETTLETRLPQSTAADSDIKIKGPGQ